MASGHETGAEVAIDRTIRGEGMHAGCLLGGLLLLVLLVVGNCVAGDAGIRLRRVPVEPAQAE